ncbi:Transcription factor, K-box [Corchorus capsularis]|uniref:Transcription factor, K-box n=1 Tax=Corchorus capsularis TaxID=210143 RepID=A0A1R3JF91_COCAP|nr:Transcription factor, K-box [Corchorus capsularis]
MKQSNYQEYLRLKGKVEVLQRSQRHFLGEDLGELGGKDLEELEHQLDFSLKQIRSTKMQFMIDQLSDLQRKEEALLETNRGLRRKLDESTSALRSSWEAGEQSIPYNNNNNNPPPHRQSEGFFEPLQCSSSMQIGYNPAVTDQVTTATASPPNGFIPGWML